MDGYRSAHTVSEISDHATGLPGPRAWQERLVTDLVDGGHEPAALLLIALEDIESMTERGGRAAADVHAAIATRAIKTVLREDDLLVRLEAGLFGIMARGCDGKGIESLLGGLSGALECSGIENRIGVTIASARDHFTVAYRRALENLAAAGSQRPAIAS